MLKGYIIQSINDIISGISVKFTNKPVRIQDEETIIHIMHEKRRTKVIIFCKDTGNTEIIFIS